jgi:hypothetical protein
VNGASPTASGLQLLPVMGGLLIASIGSGQLITRTGRYKIFPILGTAVMVVGLYLLSLMDAETSVATASGYMFVLGFGLGLVMQVLVLAVQNAVDYGQRAPRPCTRSPPPAPRRSTASSTAAATA